ncbi:ImmA/IrrE family metallo-endopeptidase [Chloroflexota bacterium]
MASWEAELWSYVGSGDGTKCPRNGVCPSRREYGICPDRHKKQMKQSLDALTSNLSDFDFITGDSESNVSCRIFQLIEKLATKYLQMGGVNTAPVPTRLIKLLDQGNAIETREVPLKSCYSALWNDEDGWVIQLSSSVPTAVRRFSLFHEGFHILAHRRTIPVFQKRGSEVGNFNELLAGYFASCLLMPRNWLLESWSEKGNLAKIARHFIVTEATTYIRLRQFGLIR